MRAALGSTASLDRCLAVVEDLHNAVAGHVQVFAGVPSGAVRVVVQREDEHKGAVDVLGVEDLQQFAQIGSLAVLVADVFPIQSNGCAGVVVVLDDLESASAPVTRAVEGRGADSVMAAGFPCATGVRTPSVNWSAISADL